MKKNKKDRDISLLGRIFLFFRTLWAKIRSIRLINRISDKQKELASYSGDGNASSESRTAYVFGISKVVCVSLLCFVLILTVLFGGSIISYENVYYMFKDIGYVSSYAESAPDALSFSKPITNQIFSNFKNGLAVASDSEIKLFTSTGRVTMTQGSEFVNPQIATSNGTILIYDQGRKGFSVYNSFVELFSKKLDFPISCADMADDGSFAVVTGSAKYKSVIQIYDASFSLEMEYSKNNYVLDAKFSDDGKYVLVLSMDTEGGESRVSIDVLDRRRGEIRSTVSLTGVMPYCCEFLSDSRFAVVCQDRVVVYDLGGKSVSEYKYPAQLVRMSHSATGLALMFKQSGTRSEYSVTVIDKNGKTVFSDALQGNVRDMAFSNKYVFVLLDRELIRIDTSFGTRNTSEVKGEDTRLVALHDGDVMVCTPGVAYYISFD